MEGVGETKVTVNSRDLRIMTEDDKLGGMDVVSSCVIIGSFGFRRGVVVERTV